MLTFGLYFLAGTGAIVWTVILWSVLTRDVPSAWQAAVFTCRIFRREKPRIKRWWRVFPVWFDCWLNPCDHIVIRPHPQAAGYVIYWPGKEPKAECEADG